MTVNPEIPNSPHAEAARLMAQQIREIVEGLDGFVFLSPNERIRVNTSSTVPDKFLESVAGAMESSVTLTSSTPVSVTEIRDVIAYSLAYLGLADVLERLARGVRETVKRRRSRVGTETLRVYSVAKHLNRPGDREQTVPFVDQMQRALKRGRRRVVDEPTIEPQARGAA